MGCLLGSWRFGGWQFSGWSHAELIGNTGICPLDILVTMNNLPALVAAWFAAMPISWQEAR